MAITPPTLDTATAVSTTQIDLTWTNHGDYYVIQVWQSIGGGAGDYLEIEEMLPGSLEYYRAVGLDPNTLHAYKLKAVKVTTSEFSNIKSATTFADISDPTLIAATPFSDTEIEVTFKDNSEGETGHRLERNVDDLVVVLEPNQDFHRDSGLTLGVNYTYRVQAEPGPSAWNTLGAPVQTIAAPGAPTNPASDPEDKTIRLSWDESTGNVTGYKIEQWSDEFEDEFGNGVIGPEWTKHNDDANRTIVETTLLTIAVAGGTDARWAAALNEAPKLYMDVPAVPFTVIAKLPAYAMPTDSVEYGLFIGHHDADQVNEKYAYKFGKVRAGDSGKYLQVLHIHTQGGLEGGSDTYSVLDEDQEIWLKIEVDTSEDVRFYVSDDGESWYQMRRGAVPYAWSGFFDDGMKIGFFLAGNDAGALTSTFQMFGEGSFDEIAKIGDGVLEYLVNGLTASTDYTFRVRAYGPGGNSGYTAEIDETTDATYQYTEYEKWIRNPNIEPVYLAEIYTKMTLDTFTPTAGENKTFQRTIGASDRGVDILEVFEGDETTDPDNPTYTSYTAVANVAAVQATAETFWFDYDNRILYVHTSDDSDPDAGPFLIEAAFWLYFTTHPNIEFTANGRLNFFLPFLSKEDISDITQEIKPYFEGNFRISSGSIAFKNDDLTAKKFFDIKYETYTWIGSKVIVKAGRDDFTYAQFNEIFTARINEKSCSDRRIVFQLRDSRADMEQKLVLNTYNTTDYPQIEEEFFDVPIPICFGFKDKVVPVCVDFHNKKFNYHDGRSKSVQNVHLNGVNLTEDTHYYVDLQRSIITLDRDHAATAFVEEDIVEVAFTGKVNTADEAIVNHAEIFKYIMNTYLELANAELDHDSIYASKYANENELSAFIYEDTPYDEIVKNIEHSGRSFTFQDTQGRLGLKPQLTTALSSVKYIINDHIFDHSQRKNKDSLFWKVNVYFDENSKDQKLSVRTATDNEVYWKYDTIKELDIYTYFYSPDFAQSLATAILALLNKQSIVDTLPMLLFDELPGNLIKYSRTRFYDADGTASEITLRIIRISKSPASGKTTVTLELVS